MLRISAFLLLAGTAMAQQALPSLSEPALSPDGAEIAFVSGGDIWAVPSKGGEAHLLVTHPATESRPLYSPDGKRLAFVSTRTGNGDIYVLTLATGDVARITYSDGADRLDAWSADGRWLYFTASVNDVAGQGDIFRVASTGGTPLEVSRERYMTEFESSPSPDGTEIALMSKGISNGQWWRNGHAHIDETELWLKPIAASGGYRRLLPADAKHAWPMWAADGRALYYMADESGAENLWSVDVAGAAPKQLTHFKQGRVLWPTLGGGGKTIVFERGFEVWRYEVGSGKVEKVPIVLRGSSATLASERRTEHSFREMALSPDGKKMAVVARGRLFATSVKDGGAALALKTGGVAAQNAAWSPDSTAVVYVAELADGRQRLELYDFHADHDTGHAYPLTAAQKVVGQPYWSPDGKSVAYATPPGELHVLAVPTLRGAEMPLPADRVVARGQLDDPTLAWSPDNQWIVYTSVDARSFTNLSVVPAAGGESHPISFLANGETASMIAWSPDGKYILFDTAQRSEVPKMARIDLLPHVPRFREDEFRDLFRPGRTPGAPPATTPATPAPASPGKPTTPEQPAPADTSAAPAQNPVEAKKADDKDTEKPKKVEPVKIVFEGIRSRLTLLPLGVGAGAPVISPDGKVLLFAARGSGQQQLYTYSLDELAREPAVPRQLTSVPGRKSDYAFTPDSKDVVFLRNGEPATISLESRTPKPVEVSARFEVDFDAEKKVVFEEAWAELNRHFFDPNFNGHDWRKLHDEWAPYAAGARTSDELRRDINLMIGELNASHSGIGAPRSGDGPVQVGNLGLRFEREPYEAGKGLIVREVIALGPAAIVGSIKPGDRLVSVDGEPVGTHNLDAMLEDTVGHRLVLGIETAGKERQAIVRPISTGSAAGLLYRQWVEERRALVDRVSGGKVGYVHLADMGDDSLQQLYLDLDAQNESRQAVIVDVRNNNGGYVNGYALDVFTRRNYLEMTPRDMTAIPSRQALGQRALGLPTALVTNESSLSDAEDFTEGYRSLGLGKVVGEPTAGWIIFTGGTALIDGSTLRLPSTRIRDLRGQDMEMHPRPVDVEVDRMLGETGTGKDAQLERAVEVLLKGQGERNK